MTTTSTHPHINLIWPQVDAHEACLRFIHVDVDLQTYQTWQTSSSDKPKPKLNDKRTKP